MRILVHHGGQQLGPYSLEEARAALAAGTLLPSDLAWQEGAPAWVPLAGLLAGVGGPPAIPGAAQPAVLPGGTETSGLAITSLVLGILSIACLSFLAGIPAVICGHIARSQIGRAPGRLQGGGMALAGLIMGYISIALLPIMAAVALPAIVSAKEAAKTAQSVNQARQIVSACRMYADAHDAAFPATLEELVPEYLSGENPLSCPLLNQPGTVGYLYYGGKMSDPPEKVLLVSKAKTRQGKRIVGRINGSVRAERYEPPTGGE